jgi:hypothetical protein
LYQSGDGNGCRGCGVGYDVLESSVMDKLSKFWVIGTTVVDQETNEVVAVCETVNQAKVAWFNLTYPEAV